MAQKKTTTRQKPKEKKNIAQGLVHIKSTFNNTIVSITDVKGDLISWASAGSVGFKGSARERRSARNWRRRMPRVKRRIMACAAWMSM